MDPEKVSAVRDWPQPKSASKLRSLLGLCNHYKRFIEGYSVKIAPLNELKSADVPFNLSENQAALQSLEWLKKQFTSAPVLATPNFDAPFVVITVASGYGVGAVLLQEDLSRPDKPRRPIAFHSAKLTDHERNYPVGEQELLAVVSALKKWRCYLEGAKGGVKVITDRLPNTFLDTKSPEQFSRRQARWQLELSRISPKWIYEKGVSNANAEDPLSRCPALQNVSRLQTQVCTHLSSMHVPKPIRVLASGGERFLQCKPEISGTNGHASIAQSVDMESAYCGVNATKLPDPNSVNDLIKDIAEWYRSEENAEQMYRSSRNYTLRDDLWRYRNLILVPEEGSFRRRCINHLPAAGHPGRNKTLEQVQRHFWWPEIRKDVNVFVSSVTVVSQQSR